MNFLKRLHWLIIDLRILFSFSAFLLDGGKDDDRCKIPSTEVLSFCDHSKNGVELKYKSH